MGRPVVLSNGRLFVGLDEDALVHDFYFPYVGLDNLTTARSVEHKIGIWVDGKFSWTDDGSWFINVDFESRALVSKISMHNDKLQLTLDFTDFVDHEYNAFIRRINIRNQGSESRDIRLFMHQVFQISRGGRGDTAMFVPDGRYILDYKGRCCLLSAGVADGNVEFDQFAIGMYNYEGKSGTFMDAEDGELSGNPVEHGGVDSVIRFRKMVEAGGDFKVDYWVAAGSSQIEVEKIHDSLKDNSMNDRLAVTKKSFERWLEPALQKVEHVDEPYRTALLKSLLVIKAHCDDRGSILASGDSSIFNYGKDYYCYCWPRDASYAVWPLLRLGIYDEALRYFAFARDTMNPDGYLMHKYQPDRAIGSTWHPLVHGRSKELAIQEDETAIVLFMMGEYYEATKDRDFVESFYEQFIYPAAQFLMKYIDDATGLPHASYDLWEEKFSTSTYTVSTVLAGLESAANLANAIGRNDDSSGWESAIDRIHEAFDLLYHPDGYFRKGFLIEDNGNLSHDDTLDISSLYGPFMFARLQMNDERLQSTAKAVEKRLAGTTPIGGVIRYEGDNYFRSNPKSPGNPWIVCTMWLAQFQMSTGNVFEAKKLLDWALKRQMPSGLLSEQFDAESGEPKSVTPLVWSHAELINTILDLYKI